MGYQGAISPYGPGQEFNWVVDVKVTGTIQEFPFQVVLTWDDSAVGLDFFIVEPLPSSPFGGCQQAPPGTLTCTADPQSASLPNLYSGTGIPVVMRVRNSAACSVSVQLSVTSVYFGHVLTIGNGSDTADLRGAGCEPTASPSPSPAATRTPTPTATPPPSATTSATATPSTSATGSGSTATLTPTNTVGAPTPTATSTASPTAPPRKFTLTIGELSSDGSN